MTYGKYHVKLTFAIGDNLWDGFRFLGFECNANSNEDAVNKCIAACNKNERGKIVSYSAGLVYVYQKSRPRRDGHCVALRTWIKSG